MDGLNSQAQFTIIGIDGDELIVNAGGCQRNIGGISTNALWTPSCAQRYLDDYAFSNNDMMGKALFFAENPHLRAERVKRHSFSMSLPVLSRDRKILHPNTPSKFGCVSTLNAYLNGALDDEAINIIAEIDVAATYPQFKHERERRFAQADLDGGKNY